MEFSRCARVDPADEKNRHWDGLSKLNSVERRGRRISRRARTSDDDLEKILIDEPGNLPE
jgi:hypothetical protein